MQIVVVQPGDSLWTIANRFGVSLDDIIRVNELENPGQLVIGQALVVPTQGQVHLVQPGESLWAIARRYGVSLEELIRANDIANPSLILPGTRLRIPAMRKRTVESNAFLEPAGTARDRAIVREVSRYLTYLSLFSYQAREDGRLVPPEDDAALAEIRATDTVPAMVITNFRDGNFRPEISHAIFADGEVRERFIANVLNTMIRKGYGVLLVDFEHVAPADRERYNQFLRLLAPRVREPGFFLATALAPKTSAAQVGEWYAAHDYPVHGEIADFVVLMTYEWGWSGGPPMAVAPIPQVRRVLDYAVSVIPRNKIMMGAPLYGYDWTLPYVPGGPFARVLTPKQAVELAWREGAAIQYDPVAQAPYFRYYDGRGREHVVWFEDARSVQAKFNLVQEYGLRGISYWVLGREFSQNWALLADNFTIRKYR